MGRRHTLGPFPKQRRWREFVGLYTADEDADRMLDALIAHYETLPDDLDLLRGVRLWAGLVIASRSENPSSFLSTEYGILVPGPDRVLEAPGRLGLDDVRIERALVGVLQWAVEQPSATLFDADAWGTWRQFDGPPFCDLSRQFFARLNYENFVSALGPSGDNTKPIEQFALEMAVITRTFSARWFHACAARQTPEIGSIEWFAGHCVGKLQLELERERSDWVEPSGNPWRRKRRKRSPALEL